jgi:hypothetical protein
MYLSDDMTEQELIDTADAQRELQREQRDDS